MDASLRLRAPRSNVRFWRRFQPKADFCFTANVAMNYKPAYLISRSLLYPEPYLLEDNQEFRLLRFLG